MIAETWKALSDDERAKFRESARLDRERYDKEKEAYTGPWKVPDVKDPTAPKKPMSSFLAFSNERRKTVAQANPNMNGTEISCLLAQLWKDCPMDVKQQYRDREARERGAFKKDRAEWQRQKELREAHDAGSIASSAQSQQSPVYGAIQTYNIPVQTSERSLFGKNWLLPYQDVLKEDHPTNTMTSFSETYSQPSPCLPVCASTHAPMHFNIMDNVPSGPLEVHQAYRREVMLPQRTHLSRFQNYSIEDVLQDDELFEDFSPAHVPSIPPNNSHPHHLNDNNNSTLGPFGFNPYF